MHLLRRDYQFEYRDFLGVDQQAKADVWVSTGGERAVVVLHDISHTGQQARAALSSLNSSWLPYLLRPDAQLEVLVLRPADDAGAKARAWVLPLSA